MHPLVLYAAAAALLAGGSYILERAHQEQLARLRRHEVELAKEALQQAIELQQLRQTAREMGIDPDQVIMGHRALRSGQVSLQDVDDWLRQQ